MHRGVQKMPNKRLESVVDTGGGGTIWEQGSRTLMLIKGVQVLYTRSSFEQINREQNLVADGQLITVTG